MMNTAGFPDISSFPLVHPGPYERNMGAIIAQLLDLFRDHVRDVESAAFVRELAANPSRWSAAHDAFSEVRRRSHAFWPNEDKTTLRARHAQYAFEELCCKSLYNASDCDAPFDPSSPFFVAGAALVLAEALGVPLATVNAILARRPS